MAESCSHDLYIKDPTRVLKALKIERNELTANRIRGPASTDVRKHRKEVSSVRRQIPDRSAVESLRKTDTAHTWKKLSGTRQFRAEKLLTTHVNAAVRRRVTSKAHFKTDISC